MFDIPGRFVHHAGMNASDRTHDLPGPMHHPNVHVHRHRHSHRRKRFHYRPEALGEGYWDWRLADVGFRELLARKGLARWAVIVLFAGLPLAGLQLAIWLLGSNHVHNWLLGNGLDALTRCVR